ncbi:MAG TPA: efflux RND transporter periplasmic adaptor subunit [Chitinophagaceae bacterium]|nr:efflux RND transporter periplasmic adaptor subunit [Chitinophagaceae bacterium]
MHEKIKQIKYIFHFPVFIIVAAFMLYACHSSSPNNHGYGPPPPESLPVITISSMPATTYQEYTASLEGSRDIEIRAQVDGYLDRIYVDEGAYVKKGQLLFKINGQPYLEQLNNASALHEAAKASLENAAINVNKLVPLVQNNVISDVQLKSAQAAYNVAKANVVQAAAAVQAARINLGYTSVIAPASGYIGKIPLKTGSLVGKATIEPLTVLSETRDIHAYFSMSEINFLQFKDQFPGATIEQKIRQMPPVELVLASDSIYTQKGKVELAQGQFDKTTGTINFRATFPNENGLLRSGNTGKIRIARDLGNSVVIPQEATFELQDKVFVFAVGDSNKVSSKPLTISGTSGNYYLVQGGVSPGERIVYTGLDRLREGVVIQPQPMSMDSLLKARPM